MLGWMSAGLIFDTKFAEIEFMNLSNVEERECINNLIMMML